MRAAQILRPAADPVVVDVPVPAVDLPVAAVVAAGLNPADRAVATGAFYALQPEPPYTPGLEAVVELRGGVRGYVQRPSLVQHGAFAEQMPVAPGDVIPLPEGADPAVAVACGIAGLAGWLPVTARADVQPGESVLVLGATGVAGRVAVQAARLRGAGRVVAVGRDAGALEELRALGADELLVIGEDGSLPTDHLEQAVGGRADVIVDYTWGEPARCALMVLGSHGRLVQVGSAAAPQTALAAPPMRGGEWSLLGFSVFNAPAAQRTEAMAALIGAVQAGEITIEIDQLSLDELPAAWAEQAASPHRKRVVLPRG